MQLTMNNILRHVTNSVTLKYGKFSPDYRMLDNFK
jgi:hypothetical protein